MNTQNKRLILIIMAVPALLLVPFIAMQFTAEVRWSPVDFTVMGFLLLGTGLAIELVLRQVKNAKQRIILFTVILATFLLIWAELAVGIFGTSFAGS